ncbi:phosphopantothenoylcysteine decarboxylase [Lineolata rhizophorae]|uniref:Phosphopantothenoylcysteine decarboxylase n=1 Tax=Lineolata rhizophorae TaxID=578093 RepID=A0A6A6PCH8_9PEZI|nr:phosphopantothenoylcysteine decarboxylase [Lineolata rhizophorae]
MAYPMPLETTGDFNHPPTSTVFSASDHFNDARPHLLLCASGSVATIKIPLIVQRLTTAYKPMPHIRIILTASSAHFLSGQSVEQPPVPSLTSLPGVEAVYADEDEWAVPWTRGSKILHIELRRWADACAVAPLSANSMAKMVQGIADNLLLSTLRAWDTDGTVDPIRWPPSMQRMPPGSAPPKKILVAPAMNTAMWRHPVTRVQVRMLEEEWGTWVRVLRPQEKELACGDTGDGAMRDWRQVVAEIADRINQTVERLWR